MTVPGKCQWILVFYRKQNLKVFICHLITFIRFYYLRCSFINFFLFTIYSFRHFFQAREEDSGGNLIRARQLELLSGVARISQPGNVSFVPVEHSFILRFCSLPLLARQFGNRPVYSVATEDILASMCSWSCQTIESCRGPVFSRAWQETSEK